MKRLFGTIFTLSILGMFYSKALEQEPSSIKYFNVGPLAALNFAHYCLHAVQQNVKNYKSLETSREIAQNPERLKILVNSYKKTPKKLQTMKRDICQTMGLDANSVQLKKHCTSNGVCTYTSYKTIIIDKEFLAEPRNQQLGVLAHEAAHIIHDDCTGQLVFDTAVTYATALAQHFVTFAFHMPPNKLIQQSVAQYVQAAYCRALEFRADKEAAQVPGAAQGLIEYFEKDLAEDKHQHALSSHPTFKERIERLQPFAQERK